jgi:hypothetical protein
MPATCAAVGASLNALREIRPDFAPASLLDMEGYPDVATLIRVTLTPPRGPGGCRRLASPRILKAYASQHAYVAPGLRRHGRAEFGLRAIGEGQQPAAIETDRHPGR